MASSKNDVLLEVAIDFGTTYSGYAFSLRNDQHQFNGPQMWYAGQGGMFYPKTPTSLLLNPNKSFNSFGFEAETRYASLAAKNEERKYYFFQRFKMDLHFRSFKKDSLIQDISGKTVPAFTVFSESIKYLKDHFYKTLNERGSILKEKDIKFVLTVPAIWSDRSKQFMRDAAEKAGIPKSHLTIALEPEAASIYCQRVSHNVLLSGTNNDLSVPGKRYLVADIGGGTADFCVHEVNEDNSLTELYRASGGPFGGTYVDKEYLKIYDIIFGKEAMEKLKEDDMEEFLSITMEFEHKKRSVTPNYEGTFSTKVSTTLLNARSLEERQNAIQSSYLKDNVWFKQDKLQLSPSLMESFFDKTLKQMVTHVEKIIQAIPDINTILLVGGYSESSLLQDRFKEYGKNRGIDIIIPKESSLAVVKGAVLFGYNPQFITARVLRFSYGIASNPIFNSSIHPEDRCYLDRQGNMRCEGAFKEITSKGTKVPFTGKTITREAMSLYGNQQSCLLRVYCTEEDDLIVVDDDCTHLGTMNIFAPAYGKEPWTVELNFVFGMTELQINATAKGQRNSSKTTLDLLE